MKIFLLKFQENVNELFKPKPAPSWRRGMREKIRPRGVAEIVRVLPSGPAEERRGERTQL